MSTQNRFSNGKGKGRSRSRSKGLTNTEKKEVKSMIHAENEDKINSAYQPDILHNSAIGAGDLIPLTPRIGTGTLDGQRVGNEIIAKSLSLQGLLNIEFNAHTNRSRLGIRVMVFSVKGYADGPGAITNAALWIGGLLRRGTDVQPFDGYARSFFLPMNHDLVTVHADKRYYLSAPFQYNTSLTPPPATSLAIQSYYMCKYFKLSVKCKNKKLRYSAITTGGGVDNTANNYGPLYAIGYCKLDGSNPDVLDTGVRSSTLSIIKYEDA